MKKSIIILSIIAILCFTISMVEGSKIVETRWNNLNCTGESYTKTYYSGQCVRTFNGAVKYSCVVGSSKIRVHEFSDKKTNRCVGKFKTKYINTNSCKLSKTYSCIKGDPTL